jgi:hypothetical protein
MKKLIYFVVYLVPIMAMGQERYAAILQDIDTGRIAGGDQCADAR